ncbi:MAG: hypothetical protein JW770_01865 [Actinobacteria bacterium]|nr:hypothetical protein [Actinomycetota bacterium]
MAEKKMNVVDLVELQSIENAISAGNSEMEAAKNSRELTQAEKVLESTGTELEELEKSYHDLESRKKKLEDTLDMQTARIKADEKKLFSGTIRDSKEMRNYQEEIEALKRNNSKLEDEILEIMEQQDEDDPKIKETRAKAEREEALLHRIKGEIEEKLEVIGNHIEGLNKRREDVQSRIPEEYLSEYRRLKPKKGGIAVSVLKDNFCSVCNMEISSKDAEKIIDFDEVYRCPLCGRILIIFREEIDKIIKELG